jgi:hypothetical protein
VPSRKGIAENLIAAGIWVALVWVIQHFSGLAAGWTVLLIFAGILVVAGLLIRGRTAEAAGKSARLPKPLFKDDAEHIARMPAAQEAAAAIASEERDRDTARQTSSSALSRVPALRFGPPHIASNEINQRGPHGWRVVPAGFPIVTLVNDPAPGTVDPVDAENVTVRVTLCNPTGEVLDRYTARMANSDEPVVGPAHTAELAEHTISPNGREWPFNTVVKAQDEPYMRVWNNDSMRRLKGQMPYDRLTAIVEARGRGIQTSETYEIVADPLSIEKIDQPAASAEHATLEAEVAQKWGENEEWVQHILVTNRGPQGRFRATITTPIGGLERDYGRAIRLLWEQSNSDELDLGRGEPGRLRFASFMRSDEGLEVKFFAIPNSRHASGTGYLPTVPYRITSGELLFDLCLRNVDTDETVERHARVIFHGPESTPRLTFWTET